MGKLRKVGEIQLLRLRPGSLAENTELEESTPRQNPGTGIVVGSVIVLISFHTCCYTGIGGFLMRTRRRIGGFTLVELLVVML